jgi:hypothetical protein
MTFTCQLSRNFGSPNGLSRPVMGSLYLYLKPQLIKAQNTEMFFTGWDIKPEEITYKK